MTPFRAFAAALLLAGCVSGQPQLKYTVVVTRHGVRSPTWTNDRLNQYSKEKWPDWGVAPGILTPHGRALMKLFGEYDRAYFVSRGLFHQSGCDEAQRVYFWADTDQRTIETGRALAEGMLPGCAVTVHSLPQGTADPLFRPLTTGVADPDRKLAAAALLGRVGGNPSALLSSYKGEFAELERVLGATDPLLKESAAVEPGKGDTLMDLTGPLRTAATFAENFLLEYTNGMTGKDLGWGRLDEASLRRIIVLHLAYAELARHTPYAAKAYGSNLLEHVVDSLQQAATGKEVPGALGKPGDAALILVGHDTSIANVGTLLNLSWVVPGYFPDETPPGGAMVFELWRDAEANRSSIRVFYTSQTLEQMHKSTPLSLANPPGRAAIFVPGCSDSEEGFPCDWTAFQKAATAAIDPAFVKK